MAQSVSLWILLSGPGFFRANSLRHFPFRNSFIRKGGPVAAEWGAIRRQAAFDVTSVHCEQSAMRLLQQSLKTWKSA